MKMSKTILPALTMLLVSALMLSTASFAWFAMSESVTANNMTVSIRSESLYLLIDAATTADETRTQSAMASNKQIAVDGTPLDGDDSLEILPTAFYTSSFKGANDIYVADGEDLKTYSNWYTATAASSDASAMADGKHTSIGGFEGYVVRYKYFVTLDTGSQACDGLWVTNFSIIDNGLNGTNLNPVKVVVACGDLYEQFYLADTNGDKGNIDLTGTSGITDQTVYEIYVYVYYDGNHADVFTNNLANLSAANINLGLTTKQPDGAANSPTASN